MLSTDDAPELDRDVEGMVVLSPHELLLVNDNDFSVEGARTRFWRLKKPFSWRESQRAPIGRAIIGVGLEHKSL